MLGELVKAVLERALEAELTAHLGYPRHDPSGHRSGNSRNGTISKKVQTGIGPAGIEVPRDRAGDFEPRLVPKRSGRVSGGLDDMIISPARKTQTAAHLQRARSPGALRPLQQPARIELPDAGRSRMFCQDGDGSAPFQTSPNLNRGPHLSRDHRRSIPPMMRAVREHCGSTVADGQRPGPALGRFGHLPATPEY